ncbi:MAG: Fic family protein [Endomicrobium sp.]|jgi:Fic family protein|nr:Fic family protein [Endomicrobium sp.]
MMQPFVPEKLPIQNINWERLSTLLGETNAEMGRYDGLLEAMPNPEILLSPLTRREAELSSKIEGTQSTMSEALAYEAGQDIDKSKIEDINVLRNYRKTLIFAEQELRNGKPFSLYFLKEMHGMLMKNSRWDSSTNPGEFRTKQVFIGQKNAPLKDVRYIPPQHFLIREYMDNWEDYLANSPEEKLVKTAIIHAQFEIIHPFDDGNGRIGRMIITLFLYLSKVLQKPMFYMSQYLENNKTQYYECLRDITQKAAWQQWLEFFLTAMRSQTIENIKKVREINNLYKQKLQEFKETTKSQYYKCALDAFFKRPIINSVVFAQKADIESHNTARNMLKKLEQKGIISKIKAGKGQAPSIYLFKDIIDLVEEQKRQ